jgi:hypothetical protein
LLHYFQKNFRFKSINPPAAEKAFISAFWKPSPHQGPSTQRYEGQASRAKPGNKPEDED